MSDENETVEIDMERLRMAFLDWLREYETNVTKRWAMLDIDECDTLSNVQWCDFMKMYEMTKGKQSEVKTIG